MLCNISNHHHLFVHPYMNSLSSTDVTNPAHLFLDGDRTKTFSLPRRPDHLPSEL